VCAPWQHVLNPLSGYVCLAERLAGSNGAFAEAIVEWYEAYRDDQDLRAVTIEQIEAFGR
jgi:hypothetical protein